MIIKQKDLDGHSLRFLLIEENNLHGRLIILYAFSFLLPVFIESKPEKYGIIGKFFSVSLFLLAFYYKSKRLIGRSVA